MDVETFIKEWWSGAHLDCRHAIYTWMKESYQHPFAFWEGLFKYSLNELGEAHSILFEKYDFYSDCVVRHLGHERQVLKVIGASGKLTSWSYDELHALVNVQVELWKSKYPINPGQTAALIMPYGIHFLVALLTALRLGMNISLLSKEDRFYCDTHIHAALDVIQPDIVITTSPLPPTEQWNVIELDLSLENSRSTLVVSHAYLPGEILQKHYNPYSEAKIHTIEATRSYLLPLRDALIALRLKPSTCFSRPLASMYLEEPCGTLMALLVGATIVFAADEVLLSNPLALKDELIEVLGVTPSLQELWMKHPGCPSNKLKFWYSTPLYGNARSWNAFAGLNQLQKVASSHLILEKEKGGIVLFSQPQPLQTQMVIHPSLGTPWKLLHLIEKKVESTAGFGLFQPEPAGDSEPHLILSQVGNDWYLSSTTSHLKEGHPYPIQLVENSVKLLDFVQHCMIVVERHPNHFIQKQFTLVVFVLPKEYHTMQQKIEEWNRMIISSIRTNVGDAFAPNRIEVFSFYPKMVKGQLDRQWVDRQYCEGALSNKHHRSIYHSLNRIKELIYENPY